MDLSLQLTMKFDNGPTLLFTFFTHVINMLYIYIYYFGMTFARYQKSRLLEVQNHLLVPMEKYLSNVHFPRVDEVSVFKGIICQTKERRAYCRSYNLRYDYDYLYCSNDHSNTKIDWTVEEIVNYSTSMVC